MHPASYERGAAVSADEHATAPATLLAALPGVYGHPVTVHGGAGNPGTSGIGLLTSSLPSRWTAAL